MLKFWNRKPTTAQAIAATTAKLHTAYDQLADGNRVTSTAEFHAYGTRWNVDTNKLVDDTTARLEQVKTDAIARHARRMNARNAIRA